MKDTMNKSGKDTLRQEAEELWEHKFKDGTLHLADYEALKLINELQVHQIELELQNEELIKAKHEAEVATEKYTDLFDFAPSGYFGLSREYEIIDLNFKGAELLGKERGNLRNQSFYQFVSGDSKPGFTAFIEKLFKTNVTQVTEIRLVDLQQSPLYVLLTGIAKENEEQCLINMVDITLRKKMEEDLSRAKEQAEESERLKTAFLQNMSHEIRTPLNAIMGFSELLKDNFDNKPNLESYSSIINQRSSDLLEIINDILDISKIESGQVTVHIDQCNLNSLFEELLAFFKEYQKRINKPHISLNLQSFTQGEDFILTDPVKLRQIFINLIGNAFKFTSEGNIEVGWKFYNNHNILFYVSDTGVGIPIDKQALVFDRFTQLQQGTNNIIGGTGLGLSIVKGLVGLLGGEIFLESEPSKGSTFSFTLPYKTPSLLHESLETENYNTKNASDTTILIVEDDLYNLMYLADILSRTDFNMLKAMNGEEAIEIATTQSVDLVLMDISLPDMDGYETTRQIRQYKPHLKIIAQSAYDGYDDKQKAFKAGFIDYISKPIKQNLLMEMLNKHLS